MIYSEPAFPCGAQGTQEAQEPFYYGMTLRDYFAAKALDGLVSRDDFVLVGIGDLCYEIADEMIAAKGK